MQNLFRNIGIVLFSLLFTLQLFAQSSHFHRQLSYNTLNGTTLPHPAYTSIETAVPDATKLGNMYFFDGEPSKALVHNTIFDAQGDGAVYSTFISNDKIPFNVDYGFLVAGDARLIYNKTTVSFGDIGAETAPITLVRHDNEYRCNFSGNDCRVYQRHYFNFDRSKVYANAETNYCKLIIIRYFSDVNTDGSPRIAHTLIIPVLIMGSFTEFRGTGVGPIQLITILRAAPGDDSYTFFQKETETSREISTSIQEIDEQGQTVSTKASVGISAGPFSSGVEVEGALSTTYTNSETNANSYTVGFTTDEKITNTEDSDLFVARQYPMDYGMQFTINGYEGLDGKVVIIPREKMLFFHGSPLIRRLQHTEKELLETEIPKLQRENKLPEVKFWQSVIAMNNRIKANARTTEFNNILTTNGGEISYATNESKSESYTQEISLAKSGSIKITASGGVEAGPISASAEVSVEKTWSFTTTTSNGNTDASGNTATIGYQIADDEFGDGERIVYNLKEDAAFGTPIFSINESETRTSCPYEGGYQRDQPSITVEDPITMLEVDSAKQNGLTLNETASFKIKIENKSDETRTYKLRVIQPNNDRDANFSLSPSTTSYSLTAGDTKNLDVLISNSSASELLAYPDIRLIFESDCDPSIADTVYLGAFYGETDANRPPDNNLVCNALFLPTDGSLQTTFTNKFGKQSNFSNINAYSIQGEAVLTPPTDCVTGWCPETSGQAAITNSVWFKFVTTSTSVVVSTCDNINDGFRSQLAVYSTTDCTNFSSFTLLGEADDNACSNRGRVFVDDLTPGDTLYVLVDGFQGATSDFGIQVTAPPPENDDACALQFLTVNGMPNQGNMALGNPNFQYSNYHATVDTDEQLLIPMSTNVLTGWKPDQIQHSVWFAFETPPNGEIIIDITNTNFDAQVSLYGTNGNICGSEWFNQYANPGANDDASLLGGLDCRLHATGLTANRYLILVDGYQGQQGTFDITLSTPAAEYDDACQAVLLATDGSIQGPFTNRGATASEAEQAIAPPYNSTGVDAWQAGELEGNFATRAIEQSAWFKFVAPLGGEVEISTCNMTSARTQLALYSVGYCGNFSTYQYLAANDHSILCREAPSNDYPNGRNIRGSTITIDNLQPNATYYLLVDGNQLTYATFSITITTPPPPPPVNDNICAAIALPTNGVVQTGYTNLGATLEQDEEYIDPDSTWNDDDMSSSVWFSFVAPASGEAEISTCDLATFNTQLAVYTITNCNEFSSATLVATNEDGPNNCATGGDSFLPITGLAAGQTYYIVVDGYGEDTGNFDIVIKDAITPGPINDNVLDAILIPVNGMVNAGYTNALATASNGEQAIRSVFTVGDNCIDGWCDNQVDNSVWFKFVAPTDGKANISTCDLAGFDTQLALYQVGNASDFSTFTLVAANDAGPTDCATFFDSYLPVEGLTAGETYYVMVDGFDGANGEFAISISPFAAPDSCPDTPNPGLNFDGLDDYVDMGNTLGNFGTGDFTIELWVKTTQTPSSETVSSIPLLSKRTICGCANFWNLKFDVNGLIEMEMIEDDACSAFNVAKSTTAINDGVWHHVAAVRAAGQLSVYVDGVLEGSAGGAANINNTDPFQIGKSGCSDLPFADYFRGSMDEIKIWSMARSASDLLNNQQKELVGNEAGLLAYYNLNEGMPASDNTGFMEVEDQSTNSYVGTVTNFYRQGATSNWVEGAAVAHLDSDNNGVGDVCETGENDNCAENSAPLNIANNPTEIVANTYQARTIISDGAIEANSTVVFKAATTITLQSGFWAKAGSNFTAMIEDCPATLTSPSTTKVVPLLDSPILEESSNELVVRVYPNPATYQLNFEMVLPEAEIVNLQLFDLTGRNRQAIISNSSFDKGFHQLVIPTTDLDAGVYFLQLANGNQVVTKRVVIQK